MPGLRKRNAIPRRRRRDDEDGESSIAGEVVDSSMSEGSAISNGDDEADVEGSDVSAEEEEVSIAVVASKDETLHAEQTTRTGHEAENSKAPEEFVSTPDTQAMLNGLKTNANNQQEELQYEDGVDTDAASRVHDHPANGSQAQHMETPAQRSKREHLEYIKQRNSNPAFVPNRGGFFLHDDRGSSQNGPFGRPYQRGRGRGFPGGYGLGRGFGQVDTEPADQQWSHDLHETVNTNIPPQNIRPVAASAQIPTAKPAATPPNRTFSISTVLGNVTVQVSLPGMEGKKPVMNVVKKQHTLLPQHRPPLRRDKPVRISIPEAQPHYIFPSTERSFIFIPRALRPNQQTFPRGRGRGSFQGSRRPSVFGGSTYTPSVGMSRKSSISIAPAHNGLQTPTDTVFRGVPFTQSMSRPVVRMPVPAYPMGLNQYPFQIPMSGPSDAQLMAEQGTPGPAILRSPPVAIPMHQPRPQKTVSVAGIESPAFKAPQQQQEQPFHQQMPASVNFGEGQTQTSQQVQTNTAAGTPLSHIPEGAVYAQPFQPYPNMYPHGAYYGIPYPGAPMFFPQPAGTMGYGIPMGGPVLSPQFMPGLQQSNHAGAPPSSETNGPANTVAHESNGMVFYYDQTQVQVPTDAAASFPTAPANGMIPMPAAPYYYPSMPSSMYYPPTASQ